MQNITTVGDQLFIQNNSLLDDLTPLHNITSIAGPLQIDGNAILTSLSGLENIDPGSILNITITNNQMLANCDVQSICDYLAGSIGEIYISNNAPGCNNPEEVEEACAVVGNNALKHPDMLYVSPNPCSGAAHLKYTIQDRGQPSAIASGVGRYAICELYTMSGIKIEELVNEEMTPGTYEMEIDLRDLPDGVYYCVMRTMKDTYTTKVIKR